jgi:serine/threonine-protein kinase
VITSFPAGAAVWLDGEDTGLVTPVSLRFDKSGRHRVVLKLAGYLEVAESWLSHPGGERTAHVDLNPVPEASAADGGRAPQPAAAAPPAAPAASPPEAAPPEVAARVPAPERNRPRRTPPRTAPAAPRARRPAGPAAAATAAPQGRGADAGVAAAPAPAVVTTGRLSLETVPWVDVYLGGRKIGRTPLVEVPLPPGVHSLLLVNELRNVKESYRVTIRAGELVNKRLGL